MTRTPRRRFGCLAAAVVLLVTTAGCVTPGMWERADAPTVSFDRLCGTAGGGRSLLVRYADDDGRGSTLRVPLGADGRPAVPFACAGRGRSPDRLIADVSADQADVVAARAGEVTDGDPPSRGPAAGAVTRSGLTAVAYRWAGPTVVPVSMSPVTEPLPDEAVVVLVPARRPRPPAVRRDAQVRAALLTPATLAFDGLQVGLGVPLLPLGLAYLALGGHFCP